MEGLIDNEASGRFIHPGKAEGCNTLWYLPHPPAAGSSIHKDNIITRQCRGSAEQGGQCWGYFTHSVDCKAAKGNVFSFKCFLNHICFNIPVEMVQSCVHSKLRRFITIIFSFIFLMYSYYSVVSVFWIIICFVFIQTALNHLRTEALYLNKYQNKIQLFTSLFFFFFFYIKLQSSFTFIVSISDQNILFSQKRKRNGAMCDLIYKSISIFFLFPPNSASWEKKKSEFQEENKVCMSFQQEVVFHSVGALVAPPRLQSVWLCHRRAVLFLYFCCNVELQKSAECQKKMFPHTETQTESL